MSALKLTGLIAALMLSAALVCSAGMIATGLLSGMGSPALTDALTFGSEALLLLGLVLWLGARLHKGRVYQS